MVTEKKNRERESYNVTKISYGVKALRSGIMPQVPYHGVMDRYNNQSTA